MHKLAADVNFDNGILRELLKTDGIDIVRLVDLGMAKTLDPEVLEWAALQERILLTHDKRIISHIEQRLNSGGRLAGVAIVLHNKDIGTVIGDLLIMAEAYNPDTDGPYVIIPLRSSAGPADTP